MERCENIEHVLEVADIYGPLIVADLGAGAGHYTVPAAKKISPRGKVYACDIQAPLLSVIRLRARESKLSNIVTIRSDIETAGGTKLKDRCVDRAIVANVLFQTQKKEHVLNEAFRILKNQGRIILVEWNTRTGYGPPLALRIPKETAIMWCQNKGAEIERDFALGEHHYGLIFRKVS